MVARRQMDCGDRNSWQTNRLYPRWIFLMLLRARKRVFKKSDMYLTAALWLPDDSGILVVGSGRDSNFNRSQIGIISYPQGIYRPITNDTNSYPSISLSADGKTIATIQSQYVGTLETATYDGKMAGKPVTISNRPPTNWFGWTPDGKLSRRAGEWHFSNECRRHESRAAVAR